MADPCGFEPVAGGVEVGLADLDEAGAVGWDGDEVFGCCEAGAYGGGYAAVFVRGPWVFKGRWWIADVMGGCVCVWCTRRECCYGGRRRHFWYSTVPKEAFEHTGNCE